MDEQLEVSFIVDKKSEHELANRAKRLKSQGAPLQLTPVERAIHFLRGLRSRASFALPAFYLFLGAKTDDKQACILEGYSGIVFKHTIEFSSTNTITLSCRKAFDHATSKSDLTGANFAKNTDATLNEVAKYWANRASRAHEEAFSALKLLQSIFIDCAKNESSLLSSEHLLCRRIGLLKQHANRSAAHISLENYEFDILDCAHVVAALTILGEIIRSFDNPNEESNYFDAIDKASLHMARQLFPSTPNIRLFEDFEIEKQACNYWKWGIDTGRHMLLKQLPYAISWF